MINDEDEWNVWDRIGDPVLHIEMRRWADVMIVAPASADIIAKMSHGISDNLLLCVMRAWDFRKKCIICPAMNTFMWDHPSTVESMSKLVSWGCIIVGPVEKVLACNEKGNGAMSSIDDIVAEVGKALTDVNLNENFVVDSHPKLSFLNNTRFVNAVARTSESAPLTPKEESIINNEISKVSGSGLFLKGCFVGGVLSFTCLALIAFMASRAGKKA